MRLKEFVINELTQAEIDDIASDAGISSDLLKKRLDKESGSKHTDKYGKIKIGDKQLRNKAFGIAQVRKPALDDINANFGTKFTMDDLQDAGKNAEIGAMYLRLLRDKYAPKYAPGKDADAYAFKAYATGPNLGKDTVAGLPDVGKPMYNPIKPKPQRMEPASTDKGKAQRYAQMTDPKLNVSPPRGPGLELERDVYDRIRQTTDKLKRTKVGQDVLKAIDNAKKGNINKDSWMYRNIVLPFNQMKKKTQKEIDYIMRDK
tara:strand:- start:65 stop:844 length:780 start_codon:yes stop_codon:yes gene_type:complete